MLVKCKDILYNVLCWKLVKNFHSGTSECIDVSDLDSCRGFGKSLEKKEVNVDIMFWNSEGTTATHAQRRYKRLRSYGLYAKL